MTTQDERTGNGTAGYGQYGTATARPARIPAAEAEHEEPRIRFGKDPHQTMPASWAETMLTLLQERSGKLFGELMYKAATGKDFHTYDRRRTRTDTE